MTRHIFSTCGSPEHSLHRRTFLGGIGGLIGGTAGLDILGSSLLADQIERRQKRVAPRANQHRRKTGPRRRPAPHLADRRRPPGSRETKAGVALVTVPWVFKQSEQNFDTHSKHFAKMKSLLLPPVDQAFAALIEDLKERGLLDSTLIAWTGEFGRTPKINGNAGRDHWVADRRALLKSFDSIRRDVDASGTLDGMDAYTARAFEMVASGTVRKALDLSQEPKEVRERFKGAESVMLARRLVEAGVGCVTLSLGGYWDHHYEIFKKLPKALPTLDRGVAALATDLSERGLDKDISVVVWGESGRTPRINHGPNNAGRDHWAPVMSVLVMGGGMRMGQVIGCTDSKGGYPKEKPYSVQRVLSTLYGRVGINPSQSFLSKSGRKMFLLEDRTEIPELVG